MTQGGWLGRRWNRAEDEGEDSGREAARRVVVGGGKGVRAARWGTLNLDNSTLAHMAMNSTCSPGQHMRDVRKF